VGLLNTPEIRQAMEELIVLSQSDLERERYLARVRLERDERSRLRSAREDGLEKGREQGKLIGVIHLCRDLLQRPLTPREQLVTLPVEQLRQLAQQLRQEVRQPPNGGPASP
jgi:hypothetical protein